MKLHLHLGAHKTASTHLQATLRENRARLSAAGVDYAKPSEVRAMVGGGRRAAGRKGPVSAMRAALAARRLDALGARAAATLVAADENSLGLCADVIRAGALYPMARPRVALWRRLAGERDATVFLAIRDYAPFFAGVHAQSIRDAAATPLSASRTDALAALSRRWPDVIADIRAALPDAKLVLWTFEDYPRAVAAILARLTNGADLRPVNRRPMATPSGSAMEAMFRAAETLPGRRIDKTRFAAIAADHPVGPGAPRYSPFAAEQVARMSAAYREDLAALRADRDLEWIKP